MATPRDIFKYPESKSPWPHICAKHILSSQAIQELREIFNIVNWDDADCIDSLDLNVLNWHFDHKKYDISMYPEAKEFLDTMRSPEFMEEIFNFYDIDYSQGYTYTLCFDWGGENTHNDYHTDYRGYPDVVTLQYYIDVENPESTLQLREKKFSGNHDTHAMSGDAIMFHSGRQTWHGFSSRGIAESSKRLSVRLRIQTNLLSKNHIFDIDPSDKLGVIIDAKDWDLDDDIAIEDFHYALAHFTLLNLRSHGYRNIMITGHHTEFNSAVAHLAESGVNKILVLFNGAFVSENTRTLLSEITSPYAGRILQEFGRLARVFVLLDLEQITTDEFMTTDLYFGDVLESVEHTMPMDLEITHLHPDHETIEFLKQLHYFRAPSQIRDTISSMLPKYHKTAYAIVDRYEKIFPEKYFY